MSLILVFTIFMLAAFAQALSGFGFALVAVPLLSLVTTPGAAVVTTGIVSLLLTTSMVVTDRQHVRWPVALTFSATATLGMPLGLFALAMVSRQLLASLIALVVAGCTVLVWCEWQLKPTPLRMGAVGALSGMLLTATGANGPPLVAAVRAFGLEPRELRATLAAVFTCCGMLGIVGFAWSELLTQAILPLCLVGGLAVPVGAWTGTRLLRSLDVARFRTVLLGALLVSAAVALVRAGASLL